MMLVVAFTQSLCFVFSLDVYWTLLSFVPEPRVHCEKW
jgi:hypothetical protein